jgi:hypothetical protein
MTQDQRHEPMNPTDKRSTETPQQAAPTHARRIDCGGAHASGAESHPGRAPAPRATPTHGAGAGRRRPRR